MFNSKTALSRLLIGVLVCALWAPVATGQTADQQADQGCSMYYEARFQDGVETLTAALASAELSDAMRRDASICLARIYVRMGDMSQARTQFRSALQQDPMWRPDPVTYPPDEVSVVDWVLRDMGLPSEPVDEVESKPAKPSTQKADETPAARRPPPPPADYSRLSFGVFGGLNRSKGGGNADDFGIYSAALQILADGGVWLPSKSLSRNTPYFGLHMTYFFKPTVGIRFETCLAERGMNFDLSGTPSGSFIPTTIEEEWSFRYLEFAPLLILAPALNETTRPLLFLGPVLGVNLNAELTQSISGTETNKEDLGSKAEGTYFGVIAGAGLEFSFSETVALQLHGRLVKGLTSVHGFTLTGFDLDVKVQDVGVVAGLTFKKSPTSP